MVEVPGGTPRLFPTIPGADNLSPSWSGDGKWLYFASKRGTEAFQIWKMPVQGGTPVRLTKNGGISPVESPDGQYLYYSKFEQGGVWRMAVQGGEEKEGVKEGDGGGGPKLGRGSKGVYFLRFWKISPLSIDLFLVVPVKNPLL